MHLLNDILDVSKIEAGRMELERVPLVVRDVVWTRCALWPSPAPTAEVELSCRVAPTSRGAILGDAGRLRQMIINLVGNALKFTRQGEVLVDVSVETVAEGQSALHFLGARYGNRIPCGQAVADL